MKGSEFVLDYIYLLYYECFKTNPNRDGSYIDSPDLIKIKKATTNPINKNDSRYFQYTITVVLNYKEIKKYLQKITKIKTFKEKYNWKGINFPSERNHWKKIEKNNVTSTLNVLYD